MTNNIFSVLAEITLQSSLLIAVVMLLRSVFGAKLDKRLRYYLWLPVLLRLALPFSVQSRLSFMNIFSAATPAPAQTGAVELGEAADAVMIYAQDASPAAAAEPFSWRRFLLVLWLAGVIIAAGLVIWSNIRFSRRLAKGRRAVDIDALPSLCQRVGVRRMPKVYTSDSCTSPCAVGLFRPVIYLPEWVAAFPEEHSYILMHELTHIRRGDNILAALFSLCCAVYWFNPLVWGMGYFALTDRELACDAGVTKGMDTEEKTAYGMALISALQRQSAGRRHAFASGFATRKKEMFDRIRSIRSGSPAARSAALCVCAVMTVALAMFGTSAKAAEAAPQDSSVQNSTVQESAAQNDTSSAVYVTFVAIEGQSTRTKGTVKLYDSDATEQLLNSLSPDDGWTECTLDTSSFDGDEYLYIAIPRDGNWSQGVTCQILRDEHSGYVYTGVSLSGDPALPWMRMSDEDYRSLNQVLEEINYSVDEQ